MDEQRLVAVLADFARTLTSDFSLQKTLDHFVERAVDALPITGAGVLLMDSENAGHHFAAATDEVIRRIESLQLELADGPCFQAYRTGERVAIPDLAADDAFPRFSPRAVEAGLGAVFSLPLLVDDRRLGVLELYTTEPGELSETDLVSAQTLADVMAAYLSSVQARTAAEGRMLRLEEQALHDPLTGLPNRILLRDRLSQALRNSERSGAVVGVLFLDVDDLKTVNDTHGHTAGDQLLVELAQRVQGTLRPGDTLARLSGDEFVVVCENLNGHRRQAEEIADRILDSLATPIDADGTTLVISVSIGIAFAAPGRVTGEEALEHADAAMYEAKRQGGGRAVTADIRLLAAHPPSPSGDAGEGPQGDSLSVEVGDGLSVEVGGGGTPSRTHLRNSRR